MTPLDFQQPHLDVAVRCVRPRPLNNINRNSLPLKCLNIQFVQNKTDWWVCPALTPPSLHVWPQSPEPNWCSRSSPQGLPSTITWNPDWCSSLPPATPAAIGDYNSQASHCVSKCSFCHFVLVPLPLCCLFLFVLNQFVLLKIPVKEISHERFETLRRFKSPTVTLSKAANQTPSLTAEVAPHWLHGGST